MKNFLIIFLIFFMCSFEGICEEIDKAIPGKISVDVELKDPKLIQIYDETITQEEFEQKMLEDNERYEAYEHRYSEINYNLYRIFEKLIRANNLSNQIWRVGIKNSPEEQNASAGAVNLVLINSSLYDSLYDNPDAIAFVLSHELSHLLLNHGQTGAENADKIAKYERNKAEMQRTARIQNRNASYYNSYGNYGAGLGNAIGALVSLAGTAATNSAINRAYARERALETEADVQALPLMARAGYDVQKSKDALIFLSAVPDVYTKKSTHPEIEKRIQDVDNQIRTLNIEALKKEGMYNLYNSSPLPVRKSADKKVLVLSKAVNSTQVFLPENKEKSVLQNAYKCYKNKDMESAQQYFKEAYNINSSDYIPALYLSYINEYNYLKTKNPDSLKEAKHWAKKANEISLNPYTLKQKLDMEEISK